MLNSKRTVFQVIGCLLQKPEFIDDDKYLLANVDFVEPFHEIIFATIHNLYKQGATGIDFIMIDSFLSSYEKQYAIFNDNNGIEYLQNALEKAKLENFEYSYKTLKKFTLLRAYNNMGLDVSDIYDDKIINPVEQEKMQKKFDSLEVADIINHIDSKLLGVKDNFISKGERAQIHAGQGLKQLVEKLKKEPAFGLPLNSRLFTTIVRGMRLTKFYIRSASSGFGKSRQAVADGCLLGMDTYYDLDEEKWIYIGKAQPTLFITTELTHDEVQTMMLAYISGVDEDKIVECTYTDEEYERVLRATEIIEQGQFWIEYVEDFSIGELERIIEKNILQHDIRYIFFDYIQSTPSLLAEFTKATGGIRLREDQILLLLSARIKELCNKYGIFIMSSTQLNAEGQHQSYADATVLSGSKAIANKVDVGCISMPPTKEDMEKIKPILEKGFYPTPNMIYSVFKNRGNKHTRVKIWLNMNLSNLRTKDCFVTDENYNLIDVNMAKIILEDETDNEMNNKTEKENTYGIYQETEEDKENKEYVKAMLRGSVKQQEQEIQQNVQNEVEKEIETSQEVTQEIKNKKQLFDF